MLTSCVFLNLAPTSFGIPPQKQRGLHLISAGAKRVPQAHSALAGQWMADLLHCFVVRKKETAETKCRLLFPAPRRRKFSIFLSSIFYLEPNLSGFSFGRPHCRLLIQKAQPFFRLSSQFFLIPPRRVKDQEAEGVISLNPLGEIRSPHIIE